MKIIVRQGPLAAAGEHFTLPPVPNPVKAAGGDFAAPRGVVSSRCGQVPGASRRPG